MPSVTITKPAKDFIIITENHGGYMAGYCFACGARGWIQGCGIPSHAEDSGFNLKHKSTCPMNEILKDDGSTKRRKKKNNK